jgi:hypothetical protein
VLGGLAGPISPTPAPALRPICPARPDDRGPGLRLRGRAGRTDLRPHDLPGRARGGHLARIDRWNEALGAYVTVCRERALEEARAAEQALGHGAPLGPLHGVPFAVKDQFDTAGVRTTSGSRLHRDRVPTEDASVVARLRSAGGILLGKLNLTEFALGGTLTHPFGQPRNPWDRTRETGGSSSGSGIAAAAALAAATLGEDTGGSVRTPAAWCGAVGLRPTWGLVPRSGCVPVAWSMDAPGLLTRSVEEAALLLDHRGTRRARRFMRPAPGDPRADLEMARAGSIGVVSTLVDSPETDAEVREAVRRSADSCAARRGGGRHLPLVPMAARLFMSRPTARPRPGITDAGHARRRVRRGHATPARHRRAAARHARSAAARARAAIRTQFGRARALRRAAAPHRAHRRAADASAQAPIASARRPAGASSTAALHHPRELAGVPAPRCRAGSPRRPADRAPAHRPPVQ